MGKIFKSKRSEMNSEIFNISKRLSPIGEPKFAFVNAYVKFYGEASEDLSIKELPDDRAETINMALKSLESGQRGKSTVAPASTDVSCERKASDNQIRGIMGIIFTRYERDYEKITVALKNYAPAVIERLKLKHGQNVYLPNFYKEISFAEADKLIKRFDAIRAQESKRK